MNFLAALLLALPQGSARAAPADEPCVAFVDVTLLPMAQPGVVVHCTVVTRGDRVVAIGPASGDGAVALPADATRIDGAGRWLLPGLIDNHVHLFDPRDLPLYLAHGVTTVRNMKGTPFHLELRDELARGERVGPRLFTAGPFVNEPDVRTPEQVEAAVLTQAEQGYDCIKVHGALQEESYSRLVEIAEEQGLPIVGHVPRNLLFSTVVEIGGFREIAHAEELLYTHFDPLRKSGDVREIAACVALVKRSGARVTPTLVAYENIAPQVDDLAAVLAQPEVALLPPLARHLFSPAFNDYVKRFDAADAIGLRANRTFQARLVKALHEAGVPITLGSDAMIPVVVPGVTVARELENLVALGLPPWEALAAATLRNGELLGETPRASERLGVVAEGGAADLLLLDRDPLADVAAVRSIVGVMSHGRWRTRADLDALLAARARSLEPEVALVASVKIDTTAPLLEAVRALPRRDDGTPALDEAFLTSVGQVYLSARLPKLAVEVLAANAALFPKSEAAKRRLAEAQARADS